MIRVRIRITCAKKCGTATMPTAWTEMAKTLSYIWDTGNYE